MFAYADMKGKYIDNLWVSVNVSMYELVSSCFDNALFFHVPC